ncbi:MAG TPA: PilZ domain-containing protein [Terriglobales bacterium]|nr:PilZ domain-containing protein [Terriglobales bacterium]
MELRSLLLSQDQPMIDVVQRALLDLGIGVEVYSTADWAREDLADSKFDAVILDCEVAGAPNLLQMIRKTTNNGRTLAFAIVPDNDMLQEVLASGANLALQKPISVDRARSSLRAAYGLIMQERRRYFRHPLDVAVRVTVSERVQLVGSAMNISEGGMAIRCNEELPINAQVKLVLLLPGEKAELECKGTIVWKDARGHAGARFEQMSVPNRQKLNDWLEARATFL